MNFYESPLFVELLIDSVYLLLLVAAALTVWSVLRSLLLRRGQGSDDRMPARRIAWGVAVLLVLTLAVTALLADTSPLLINGRTFTDVLWLRLSDMFIDTSLVLMTVAVGCLIVGHVRKIISSRHV